MSLNIIQELLEEVKSLRDAEMILKKQQSEKHFAIANQYIKEMKVANDEKQVSHHIVIHLKLALSK